MPSTVACFCGNVYTAPPDSCPVCGSTIEAPADDDAAPTGQGTRATARLSSASLRFDVGPSVITAIDAQLALLGGIGRAR